MIAGFNSVNIDKLIVLDTPGKGVAKKGWHPIKC